MTLDPLCWWMIVFDCWLWWRSSLSRRCWCSWHRLSRGLSESLPVPESVPLLIDWDWTKDVSHHVQLPSWFRPVIATAMLWHDSTKAKRLPCLRLRDHGYRMIGRIVIDNYLISSLDSHQHRPLVWQKAFPREITFPVSGWPSHSKIQHYRVTRHQDRLWPQSIDQMRLRSSE